MNITKRIKLDFARSLNPIIVWAKQGDENSRCIEIEPMLNGMVYTLPSGAYATFACKKPDKHLVYNPDNHLTISDNIITVTLSQQTLAASGEAICSILLHGSDGSILSTQNFLLKIEESPLDMAEIDSGDELGDLFDFIAKGEALIEEIKNTVKPNFNLAALGLPAVPLDGSIVTLETDTTEILEAMEAGAIKVAANYEHNGVTANGLQTVIHSAGGVGSGVQNVFLIPIIVSLMVTDSKIQVSALVVGAEDSDGENDGGASFEVDILPSTEIPFTDSGEGVYTYEVTPSPITLTVGETYYVEWGDGITSTTHECVAGEQDGAVYIGNLSIAGMGSDSGEPFACAVIDDGSGNKSLMAGTLETDASHTVRLYQIVKAASLPGPGASDDGKILQVVDGSPAWVEVANSTIKDYIDSYIEEALGGDY